MWNGCWILTCVINRFVYFCTEYSNSSIYENSKLTTWTMLSDLQRSSINFVPQLAIWNNFLILCRAIEFPISPNSYAWGKMLTASLYFFNSWLFLFSFIVGFIFYGNKKHVQLPSFFDGLVKSYITNVRRKLFHTLWLPKRAQQETVWTSPPDMSNWWAISLTHAVIQNESIVRDSWRETVNYIVLWKQVLTIKLPEHLLVIKRGIGQACQYCLMYHSLLLQLGGPFWPELLTFKGW